jgi:O-antigen ligase
MKLIRVGLCALVGFEVLAIGGVISWAEAILELSAAGLFLLWGIIAHRRRQADIYWNWLYLPLLGLGTFALLQSVFRLTASPYLTKVELLKWAAYLLLFFLTVESFHTVEQANYLVWFLILLGFFVSLFGIVQHFTFNGRLYWFVPLLQGGTPFGPYVDRDHFAGFVELTAPLGFSLLLFRSCRPEKLTLLFLFTILPIGALILSASRGGTIGLSFELLLLALLSRVHQFGRKQLLAGAALAFVAGTFIVWLGVSEAERRFELLTHEELSREPRLSLYRDTWQIFTHHPLVGTGLGTLVVVHPRYESVYDGTIVDHAHNDYLELLAETGMPGGLVGVAFVVTLLRRGLKNLLSAQGRLARAIQAGALVACLGLLLHSLVDFNLHILANALVFLTLASLATSQITVLKRASHGRGRTFVSEHQAVTPDT